MIALLAVHVDDVRLIAEPEKEKEVTERLNSLFTFGDWNRPTDWTKFCGRFEKQLEDGTVLVQMDNYSERLSDPPQRTRGEAHPLLPNERKWIGTICGQLNWMARQCRADLAFGVSRVQQLAGVADPAALTELRVLVERARMPVTVKIHSTGMRHQRHGGDMHLGCFFRRHAQRPISRWICGGICQPRDPGRIGPHQRCALPLGALETGG